MRGFVLGLATAAIIVLVASMWHGSATPQTPGLQPAPQSTPAAIVAVTPVPSAIPTACDETEELMARMFVGLTQAVLTESGKTPEDLSAAIAADREIWRRYLEVLDIPVDGTWLDAAISPDLDQRLVSRCLQP